MIKVKLRDNKIKRLNLSKKVLNNVRKIKQKIVHLFFLISSCLFLSSCLLFQSPPLKDPGNNNSQCSTGNARFIADQISTPDNYKPITIKYKEGLADSFTVNLKTCLKDSLRPDASIQNSSFEILYDSNLPDQEKPVKVISNTEGCIQWEETYKYKYTLKSSWIGLKRVIRQTEGAYSGGVEIETAVNPWLSPNEKEIGLPQILDMRCEYINRSIFKSDGNREQNTQYHKDGLRFLETADQKKPLLWAPHFSLQVEEVSESKSESQAKDLKELEIKRLLIKYKSACQENSPNESCYKRYFKIYFHVPLEFRSLDSSSSFDTELNGGVYNIKSFLMISPKGDNKTYNLAVCDKNNIEINENDKFLNFSCIFDIAFFNQNSVFKILHKISTVNPDKSNKENYLPMRDFQGTYTIEFKFGSLLTGVTIDANDNNIYSEVLRDSTKNLNFISKIDSGIIAAKNKNQAKSVNLKVLQLGATGDFKYSNIQSQENTIEREISFVGKICMTDALNSQKLENTKFRVFLQKPRRQACKSDEGFNESDTELSQIITGQIEEVFSNPQTKEKFETDNEKCLTIPIAVPHKIFNKQRYFEIIAHLLSEDLNLYGSVKLALNPWQRAFQAFQDAQNLDEKNIRFEVKDISPPELVINQFRSINLFPSYGLDKLLNIHIFHRFYLLFQPFIRRPDNVSLGLNHQARELLRDGYYLVRVLILRNPKETGHWETVQNQENLNQTRAEIQVEQKIDLSSGDYITHTDSVVRAKANFVNFYMPIYLSTKQMYYIASRNMIVVQIYPADPNYIVYKSDGSVDSEKTKWRAFVDHDLVNQPYGGAVNLQNWVNWNLLQPVNINTDEVIELSPVGRKYKHFDFSKLGEGKSLEELDLENCQNRINKDKEVDSNSSGDSNEVSSKIRVESEECEQALSPFLGHLDNFILMQNKRDQLREKLQIQIGHTNKLQEQLQRVEGEASLRQKLRTAEQIGFELTGRLEEIEKELGRELDAILDQSQFSDKESADKVREFCFEENLRKDYDPGIEIYRREVESKYTPELLNYFSLENALKPIVLGTEEAQGLKEDLKNSYQKYLKWKKDWKQPITSLSSKNINKNDFIIDPEQHPIFEKHRSMLMLHRYIPIHTYYNFRMLSRFDYVRGRENVFAVRHLIDSYLLMLKKYSSQDDFSSVLFDFVQENKLAFNIESELAPPDSCKEEEYQTCSEEKLKLLIKSNLFENLIFSSDMPVDVFIKRQALIFMMFFILPEKALDFLEGVFNPYSDLKYIWFKSEDQSKIYFTQIQEFLRDHEGRIIEKLNITINPFTIQKQAIQELDQITQNNYLDSLIYDQIDSDNLFSKKSLKALIDKGVKTKDINNFESLPFFKSLCVFWFEDFMKKYLDTKTKISTYTNYVRQFNYLQILEHAYVKNQNNPEKFMSDLQSVINEVEQKPMEEEERACHIGYRQCVSEDFCFAKPISQLTDNDSKAHYCQSISPNRKSCSNWVKDICVDPDNKNLSLCEPNFVSEACYKDVNYFCRLNPDKNFCADFENRCFKKYTGCLESSKLFQKNLDQILNTPTPAIETCVKDFNEFFKLENKMIVYDISSQDSDLKYRGGFLRNFGFSFNNSIGSYMNWTAQRGQSVSVSLDPTKLVPNIFTLGLSASMSQSQSGNESNSGRIAWDGRAGEAVFLSIGKAEVEIGVKKFQKCLIVKPRPNSFVASFQTGEPKDYKNLWSDGVKDLDKIVFSRPGLILCNPVEERNFNDLERIRESYYYITQANTDPSNSQFLDLYDLANRPFILILRGKREFLKFYHMARRISKESLINEQPNNQFVEHTDIAEYAGGLSLKLREVTQTGFYPGVYDYPFNVNEEIDASYLHYDEQNYIIQNLHSVKIFGVPNTNKGVVPIQK